MTQLIAIIIAYIMGCLATGYYLTRWVSGEDIRLSGSGGSGATNVARLLGKRGFVLTLSGDFSKGLLAVLLARVMVVEDAWLMMIVLAVVVGHIWPVQLQFNGGKGVATAAGGLLAVDPPIFFIGLLFFVLLFIISRSSGFSGLVAALSLPFIHYLRGGTTTELLILLSILSLLIWAHRENLRNGRLKGFNA